MDTLGIRLILGTANEFSNIIILLRRKIKQNLHFMIISLSAHVLALLHTQYIPLYTVSICVGQNSNVTKNLPLSGFIILVSRYSDRVP